MRRIAILLFVAALSLGHGCVTRTTTRSPSLRERVGGERKSADGKIVETKTVWFWDDEYRQK